MTIDQVATGGNPTPIRTYRDYSRDYTEPPGLRLTLRTAARDAAVWGLSTVRSIRRSSGWIRFPYYHHVFDDEVAGFDRQLSYLARFADFISMDDAIEMLTSGEPIDGRFFCINFDDGFKNCLTNAAEVLADHEAPATVFVSSALVGTTTIQYAEAEISDGRPPPSRPVEYLSWKDCKTLTAAGVSIGSHSDLHVRLGSMAEEDAAEQMRVSKEKIEAEIGEKCLHFCCPYGHPGRDFLPDREPKLAHEIGYKSFSTGERGAMRAGDDPFFLHRDHLLAGWGNHQLKYFLGT